MIERELEELNFEINVSNLVFVKMKKWYFTNVYTYCLDGVQINLNNQTVNLSDALKDDLISIDKIVRQNEIIAQYAQGLKETFDDDILLSNLEYSVLVCSNGNYIIGSSDLEYSSNLCN